MSITNFYVKLDRKDFGNLFCQCCHVQLELRYSFLCTLTENFKRNFLSRLSQKKTHLVYCIPALIVEDWCGQASAAGWCVVW